MTVMGRPPHDPIFTNIRIYRDIAAEALKLSETAYAIGSRSKEDGSLGKVLSYDPGHTSHRQSLVAIVFSGMYIEARLWLVGCSRIGYQEYRKIDKNKPPEERLAALGVSDQVLMSDLKKYRELRRALVHEKPLPLSMDTSPIRIAQTEAKKAVVLMDRVDLALKEGAT